MKCTVFKSYFRVLAAVIFSIGFHALCLMLPYLKQNRTQQFESAVPVKVSETVTSLRSVVNVRRTKTQAGQSLQRRMVKRHSGSTMSASSISNMSYRMLLPSDAQGAFIAGDGKSGSGEPNGALDVVKSARSKPLMDAFAAEIRARIDTPLRIYHLRRNGSARASVNRLGPGKWRTKIHGADPYARAILLRAMSSIQPGSFGMQQLEKSDWQSVEIAFSFQWRNKFVAVNGTEGDTKVVGNQIEIAMVHVGGEEELNPTLRRTLVLAPLLFGVIDPIGIYNEFIKQPVDSGPKWDFEIRRLEQSAAFSKPLLTVPLGLPPR